MIYSITEGKQAEEYRARKAKEAEDTKKAEESRNLRRERGIYNGPNNHRLEKNADRADNMLNKLNSDIRRREKEAIDAGERYYNYSTNTRNRNDHVAMDRRIELAGEMVNKGRNLANVGRINPVDFSGAIVRYINRHPNAYKESCGIFSSVDFI